MKIATALGTTVEYLVTGKDKDGLSHEEQGLINNFRLLDIRDREDVIDNVHSKLERKIEREKRNTEDFSVLSGVSA